MNQPTYFSTAVSSRWRRALFAVALSLSLSIPVAARAGGGASSFGGFAADESVYLRGIDKLCRPIPAGLRTGAASCSKAETDAIAKAKIRKPAPQRGPRAAFSARASGSDLTVVSSAGRAVVEWSSVDPIASVGKVYASPGGRMVAVELRVRFGGRITDDVVVFAVADSAAARAQVSAAKTTAAVARAKPVQVAINAGWKQLKRKRYKSAEAAFRKALALRDDPEAHFGIAVSMAARRKIADALVELKALAAGTAAEPGERAVWQVAARHDKRFKKLRANPEFRRAVGIDPIPGAKVTAYERLVGATANWEAAGASCESPRVNLILRRRPQTFKLRLRTTCQGYRDNSKFSGSWTVAKDGVVKLTLPNRGGESEAFDCSLATCTDGSKEDCLVCGAGSDLEMTLRPVRR